MDANALAQSFEGLMSTFYKRMDSFEDKLQKTPATTTTETLAAEFATFKVFVVASMKTLQEQIGLLAKETDQLEMRSRRKILLLHGIPETSNEVIAEVVKKTIVERLKLTDFGITDINRCHRMGRAGNADKPRPILFKLRDIALRDKIWSSKASLKGTGVTVSEFLTKTRHIIFMAAREQFGLAKCWTREGFVYVLSPDGTRHRLSCQEELDKISHIKAPIPKTTVKSTTETKKSSTTIKVKRNDRK